MEKNWGSVDCFFYRRLFFYRWMLCGLGQLVQYFTLSVHLTAWSWGQLSTANIICFFANNTTILTPHTTYEYLTTYIINIICFFARNATCAQCTVHNYQLQTYFVSLPRIAQLPLLFLPHTFPSNVSLSCFEQLFIVWLNYVYFISCHSNVSFTHLNQLALFLL